MPSVANPQKPAEPVRLYAEDDYRLPRTVEQQLVADRDSLIAGLVDGAAKDFAEYREKVGEIRGITAAISICQAARKELSGN